MDTIIWLISNHQIYVGDFYKGEVKTVPFEKADTWEVYGADDIEKLVDYMNYPLHYNQFKKSRLIILFDEIKIYEMLRKVQRCFKNCEAIAIKRIEPFLIQAIIKENMQSLQKIEFADEIYKLSEDETGILLSPCLEEGEDGENVENSILSPMSIYECIITLMQEEKLEVESVEDAFKHELILSPTTLYTKAGQKEKRYLQVEDIVLGHTVATEGHLLEEGDVLLKYEHNVQKMFGRIKTEEITKQVTRRGKLYYVKPFDEKQLLWTLKDEVIGIIGTETSTRQEVVDWYKKNIII